MGKDLRGKELGKGLCQRKNGKYCGRYVDRFGERKSVYGDNLREVKKRLSELEYLNSRQISAKGKKMKLEEWFGKWFEIYKYDVIRPTTRMHYKYIYEKHIAPLLGNSYLMIIPRYQHRCGSTFRTGGFQIDSVNP